MFILKSINTILFLNLKAISNKAISIIVLKCQNAAQQL